jgi:hypothetical protein
MSIIFSDAHEIHCPGAGPGQGRLIFAGPDPGPQGQGRVRARPGPTPGPAIFRYVEKYIIYVIIFEI